MNEPRLKRALFITGIPGAGKTTLATYLAEVFDRPLLTMHSLVERIDPESLARGDMADEAKMRRAFIEAMDEYAGRDLVVDGWPRTQGQALLLPDDAQVILMRCRVDIARDRLLRRERADDTPELVEKRIREQETLLNKDGWAYALAGWEGTIATDYKNREQVQRSVYRYLIGEKQQAFDG